MKPTLSLIILNYCQKDFCERCLQSIFESEIQVPFEVILIDNASPTRCGKELQKKWGEKVKVVLNDENLGFGRAHNAVLDIIEGEYTVLVNPDTEVEKDTIQKLYEYIKSHHEAGIVAPQLYYPSGAIQDSYRRFPTPLKMLIKRTFWKKIFKKTMSDYMLKDFDTNTTQTVDWVVGAFLIIKTELFQTIGGFDDRYFLFLEDTDLCREVWKRGKEVVYYPKTKALHNDERLSGGNLLTALKKKSFRYHIASAIKYFLKWGLKTPQSAIASKMRDSKER